MITTPDNPALDRLCAALSKLDDAAPDDVSWPAEALARCGEAGVFRWFLPREWGGEAWSDADLLRGYMRLAAGSLTTTFVITQRSGACRWLAEGLDPATKERWLPGLASGESFATVGISHLTTSRRHLALPVLRVEEQENSYVLDGESPWVTGGAEADVIVTGGTLADGRQVLVAVDTSLPGVEALAPFTLVGLSGSHTGPVRFRQVRVPKQSLLAGPAPNVMSSRSGSGAGGLQTSALAVGLSAAAIRKLDAEARTREDLRPACDGLGGEHRALEADLLSMAAGAGTCSSEELRTRANSLVLRSTQAYLAAAKGTGYVVGHPAGRFCREALFFLVWSCPQGVVNATLCELAGLSD